uniref:Uncharacterized protein n=1 Tax=Romanomermis culicivorax TaxID=13658 RepID=A0A915HI11_ROMCU
MATPNYHKPKKFRDYRKDFFRNNLTTQAKLNATQEKFDQSRKRVEEYQEELRKVQTETDHANELGHQKDVQIKFLHDFYVKRRENLENSRRMHALFLDKKTVLKKELAALENEPEKLAKKFETLMARQHEEYMKQESIYDSIEWAKNFKVKYGKNVSLKEQLDEAKHQLTMENNKLNDYENELLVVLLAKGYFAIGLIYSYDSRESNIIIIAHRFRSCRDRTRCTKPNDCLKSNYRRTARDIQNALWYIGKKLQFTILFSIFVWLTSRNNV